MILGIIHLESAMDMLYEFMKAIDSLDLTGDVMYFTRFPNRVRNLCFITPDMKWFLYWEFGHCNIGINDVGIPSTAGILPMWSDIDKETDSDGNKIKSPNEAISDWVG